MFKHKYNLVACCLGLLLTFSSCNKWLELKPNDGIIREEYWKTKEDVHAAIIGCYGSLLGEVKTTETPLAEKLFIWGELRADMLAPSTGTGNNEYDIMNLNTVSTNNYVNWSSLYKTINYCNTVIDFAPEVIENDKTFTQSALDGYIAEAKGLRALMYFYLARSFGEVPLKLKSTSSDEEITSLPKSSKTEVLNQIVKDLEDAEPKALTNYGDNNSNKGRITRYTINAIQADVYLWMDRYEECITACDKLINSKQFGLIANGSSWFNTLYRTGNSTESIFEFQFSKQKLNTFYPMFSFSVKTFEASNRVLDEVFTVDPLGNSADIRADGASVRSEDNMIWKYTGKNFKELISPGDSYVHWFVYRYADILLMKAEALAHTSKGQEALDLVKLIRDRAGALPATDNAPDPSSTDDVALFILEERAREFMFEGKRWYDVLRYVKRNNYAKLDYLLDMVSRIVPANSIRTAQTKLKDYNSHYFPIYEYEISTNKNLVQNPFYK